MACFFVSWLDWLVDADSFHCFDDIYDSQIKFTFRYLLLQKIQSYSVDSLGDIRNLSRILHYPGA